MKPEIASCYMDGYNAGVIKALGKRLDEVWYSTRSSESSKSYAEICSFHSGADTERDKEQDDDSVDDFVELEKDRPSGDEIDVGSSFEHSAENVNDDMSTRSDQLGMETGDTEKNFSETNAHSAFTKLIISTQPSLLGETLDKWVKEGNQVTQEEVSSTLRHLIFRKLFINALQVCNANALTVQFISLAAFFFSVRLTKAGPSNWFFLLALFDPSTSQVHLLRSNHHLLTNQA